VEGKAAPGGGVKLSVCQARAVSEFAERPRRQREEETENEGDSSSDAELVDAILPVVDTDDEKSAGSLDSSSSSTSDADPFDEKLIIAAKPLKPELAATGAGDGAAATATGVAKLRRTGYEPLWSDRYFAVWGFPGVEFVRVLMRDVWRMPAPGGMGAASPTRQVTPRHYEETVGDPVRSVLLLRAWCLWRARQGGWAYAQRGRARHFREQEVLLERDVKALGSRCRLLGHRKANHLLQGWVPEIVARLRG